MISLKDNKTALYNLQHTIGAIDTLNYLLAEYKQDKAGPAYCSFDYVAADHKNVQFHRSIMVAALEAQKDHLVKYLADLGIEVDY